MDSNKDNAWDMSPSNVEYLEKVYSYVRRNLARPQEDTMERINTIAMTCGLYIIASKKTTVHLGRDDEENLRATKNTDFDEIKPLFNIKEKLMDTIPWVRSTLLNDRSVELSTAMVHVFSDSVLCLGGGQHQMKTGKLSKPDARKSL